MRRSVVAVMSGVSVAVVGLGLRGSGESRLASLAAAPPGIVTPTRAPAGPVVRPAVVAARAPRPTPRTVTVNGAPADTPYGPVQVQITITNGRITRATAIDYPHSSGRDQEINSQAIPRLDEETVRAHSVNIDTVSGATYTSNGYRQSLQSALDAAHAR